MDRKKRKITKAIPNHLDRINLFNKLKDLSYTGQRAFLAGQSGQSREGKVGLTLIDTWGANQNPTSYIYKKLPSTKRVTC